MKKKWFNVDVSAHRTLVVEIEYKEGSDPEDIAMEIAVDNAFNPGDDVETNSVIALESQGQIEQAKRFADKVISL